LLKLNKMKLKKNEKLITVKNFADQYPSKRNGTGVNVGYIYKLLSKGRNDNWDLIQIDGVHFIKITENANSKTN